jgi:hypothetical protein
MDMLSVIVFYFRQVPLISEIKIVEMLKVSCLLHFKSAISQFLNSDRFSASVLMMK